MDCIAKFRAALLILAFVPSLSRAADPWETTDYALAGAALTALAVDWGQTRYIAKNTHRYNETNPMLGATPSVGKVDTYFVAMVGTVALAHILPGDWRQLFLAGTLAVEIGAISKNRSIGIKMAF
jgi:hypothetical protein